MAYPLKRRKLSNLQDPQAGLGAQVTDFLTQQYQEQESQQQRTPPSIDEVHLRVRSERAARMLHKNNDGVHRQMHRRGSASGTAPVTTVTAVTTVVTITAVETSTAPTGPASPILTTVSGFPSVSNEPTLTLSVPSSIGVSISLGTQTTFASGLPLTTVSNIVNSLTSAVPSVATSIATSIEGSQTVLSIPAGSIVPSTITTLNTGPITSLASTATAAAASAISVATSDLASAASLVNGTLSAASAAAQSLLSSAASSEVPLSLSAAAINATTAAVPGAASASLTTTASSDITNATASITAPSGALPTLTSIPASDLTTLVSATAVSTLAGGKLTTVTGEFSAEVTTLPNGVVTTELGALVTSFPTHTSETSSSSITGGGASPTSSSGSGVSSTSNDGSSSTPPPQIIAGGVVGGLAGIAAILFIALLFLRWYRRRSNMQRLDEPSGGEPTTGRGGMTERAGLLPFATAAAAVMGRRSRKAPEVPASERGFQKISGRKLPSAFSDGITALPAFENPRPVPMPAAFAGGSRDPNRPSPTDSNERAYYRNRDSDGYFTGSGEESGSRGPSPNDLGPPELQPGPARQATVHQGGGYSAAIVNPFETPPPSPRMPMLEGRSVTPMTIGPGYQDPRSETPRSHSSRFMEEV